MYCIYVICKLCLFKSDLELKMEFWDPYYRDEIRLAIICATSRVWAFLPVYLVMSSIGLHHFDDDLRNPFESALRRAWNLRCEFVELYAELSVLFD